MKVSTIIERAANEWLWDGVSPQLHASYSCWAALNACDTLAEERLVCNFLCKLGVNCNSGIEFSEFQKGAEQQSARYAWLMFAALYAKELGI